MSPNPSPDSFALPERVSVVIGPEGRSLRFRCRSSASKWLVLFVIAAPIALGITWHDLLTSPLAQAILAVLGSSFPYVALAGWFNTSTLTPAGGQFRVWHSPFPWPGGCRLPAASIRAPAVEDHNVQTETGQRLTFRLIATDQTDRPTRLVFAFDRTDRAAAGYLGQTPANWLPLGTPAGK
jgi:hypothetical protein